MAGSESYPSDLAVRLRRLWSAKESRQPLCCPDFGTFSIPGGRKYPEKANTCFRVAAVGLRCSIAVITFCYNMRRRLWKKCAPQNNIAAQNY